MLHGESKITVIWAHNDSWITVSLCVSYYFAQQWARPCICSHTQSDGSSVYASCNEHFLISQGEKQNLWNLLQADIVLIHIYVFQPWDNIVLCVLGAFLTRGLVCMWFVDEMKNVMILKNMLFTTPDAVNVMSTFFFCPAATFTSLEKRPLGCIFQWWKWETNLLQLWTHLLFFLWLPATHSLP